MSEFLDKFAAAFKAIDEGDTTKIAALIADDIVMTTPNGQIHGKAAVMEKFDSYGGAFTEIVHEVDFESGVIDAGDALAVEFTMHGRHTGILKAAAGAGVGHDIPATGRKFSTKTTDHVWWRNGKIYRFNIYLDPTERLRQLGVDYAALPPAALPTV